ncbi:MAG: hypothetical protein JWO42_3667 [Chloroflexi bacterium]|nr:hypothetical protein [Chloroflexota bacterium]
MAMMPASTSWGRGRVGKRAGGAHPKLVYVDGGYSRDDRHIRANTEITLELVRRPTDANTREMLSKL